MSMKSCPIFFVCLLTMLGGCSKQTYQLDKEFVPLVKVTESKDSLIGGIDLYRWQNIIVALQGLDDGTAKCFLLNHDSNYWSEVQFAGVPRGYLWAYPTMSKMSNSVLFQKGYMENDLLVMNTLIGRMAAVQSIAVLDAKEKKWYANKSAFFESVRPDIRLNDPGKRNLPSLGKGVLNGSDICLPYCLTGEAWRGNGVSMSDSLFSNGVFNSTDSGISWQVEKISNLEAWLPSAYKTEDYYYYLAVNNYQRDLWFSRKKVDGNAWDAPKAITQTFANSASYWKYVAMAENDVIHVCWLDRRHEKKKYNMLNPDRDNFEVVYNRRKDSDAHWNQDVILSKGMLYSYSPAMSVEGDKIVAAWAGVQKAPDWHSKYAPNDIYYVTSKDGGKTWTEPLKVTDGAKDGITSGEPQVMLMNGVIHLTYIQGKMNLKEESPGLTKLNQPPWPIYYTQRPFPN